MAKAKIKEKPMLGPAQAARRQVASRLERGEGVSTPERLLKTGQPIDIGEGRSEDATVVTVQRVMDWPIRRLYDLGSLGKDKGKARLTAAENFYRDWMRGGMGAGPAAIDLNRTAGGEMRDILPSSEAALIHRERYHSACGKLGVGAEATIVALVALNEVDLMEAAAEFVDDLYKDTAMRKACAISALCVGLDRLVDYYGLGKEKARIQAWRNF